MEDIKEKTKAMWNRKAEGYSQHNGKPCLSLFATISSLAGVQENSSIIEVGCGPGEGTKFLTAIYNVPFIMYSLDLSKEMLSIASNTFKNYSDFNANKDNYYELICPQSSINVQNDCENQRKEHKGRIIKFLEGDSEKLPFEDAQFDIYLSSLCITNGDYPKALQEAYRVLRPGGKLAFAVWGKRNETTCRLVEDVMAKHGLSIFSFKNYAMSENEQQLKQLCTEIGFNDIRIDYTNAFRDIWDVEGYKEAFFDESLKKQLDSMPDQSKAKEIYNDIDKSLHQLLEVDCIIPKQNALIFIAKK